MSESPKSPVRAAARWRVAAVTLLLAAAALSGFTYLLILNSTTEAPPDPFEALSKLYPQKKQAEKSSEVTPSDGPMAPFDYAATEIKLARSLVGEASCRECHPGEAALYSGSGHSRTMRPAALTAVAEWLDGRTVKDPENPDVSWTYSRYGGRLEVERSERGSVACYPLEYALGSGANGVTFMTFKTPADGSDETLGVEHRLSYLADGRKLDVTPGQGKGDSQGSGKSVKPHGRELDGTQLEKCVSCHATVPSTAGVGRVDASVLVPNVSCERCHGPGLPHIDAAGRPDVTESDLLMTHGPTDAGPLRQIALCGQCHRTINSISAATVSEDNPEIARFQPVGLVLSHCFQDGKSGLSCTSCHDPHAKVSRDRASYDRVCVDCHSPLSRKNICPVSTREGCVECHMPKRTVSEVFQFTDHWIRRPKPQPKPSGGAKP